RETSIVSVGASHHPGQRRQCGIRQLVSVDEGIKGALCTVMTELDLWNVIRDRVLSIRDFPNSVRRDEQEFGLRIDKARDQPGTGDAIDARTLTGDPLHGDLLSTLEVHGRATSGGASLFVHRDRGGDILERGSRTVEDRDLGL